RIFAGNFETLVPTEHGDQIQLVRFDGKVWHPPLDVTDAGLDIWRPTVAVDGKGVVWVAWSQQVSGDWDIFCRAYTPAANGERKAQWSESMRVTQSPGTDMNVVAATDSAGTVWLAWQGWRDGNFDILLASLANGAIAQKPTVISNSKANDWNPAIATDKR